MRGAICTASWTRSAFAAALSHLSNDQTRQICSQEEAEEEEAYFITDALTGDEVTCICLPDGWTQDAWIKCYSFPWSHDDQYLALPVVKGCADELEECALLIVEVQSQHQVLVPLHALRLPADLRWAPTVNQLLMVQVTSQRLKHSAAELQLLDSAGQQLWCLSVESLVYRQVIWSPDSTHLLAQQQLAGGRVEMMIDAAAASMTSSDMHLACCTWTGSRHASVPMLAGLGRQPEVVEMTDFSRSVSENYSVQAPNHLVLLHALTFNELTRVETSGAAGTMQCRLQYIVVWGQGTVQMFQIVPEPGLELVWGRQQPVSGSTKQLPSRRAQLTGQCV